MMLWWCLSFLKHNVLQQQVVKIFFFLKFNFALIKICITYGCLAESVLSADKKCGTHVCFFPRYIYPTYIACKALSIQILLHGYMPIKPIKPSNIFMNKKKSLMLYFWYIYFIFRKKKEMKTEKQRVKKIAILRVDIFCFLKISN